MIQRPLTYRQWEQLRDITKGKGLGVPEFTAKGVGDWVNRALDARLLPKVAAIILQVHEPTPIQRWLNRRKMKAGWSIEDAVASSPEFADAIADFFLLNVTWLENWLNMPLRSGLLGKRTGPSPGMIAQSLVQVFSSLAAATSPKPYDGGIFPQSSS